MSREKADIRAGVMAEIRAMHLKDEVQRLKAEIARLMHTHLASTGMVYCCYCRRLWVPFDRKDIEEMAECHARGNKDIERQPDTWRRPGRDTVVLRHKPHEINANNDCAWFEVKCEG